LHRGKRKKKQLKEAIRIERDENNKRKESGAIGHAIAAGPTHQQAEKRIRKTGSSDPRASLFARMRKKRRRRRRRHERTNERKVCCCGCFSSIYRERETKELEKPTDGEKWQPTCKAQNIKNKKTKKEAEKVFLAPPIFCVVKIQDMST
jgi:hypothetical protein